MALTSRVEPRARASHGKELTLLFAVIDQSRVLILGFLPL